MHSSIKKIFSLSWSQHEKFVPSAEDLPKTFEHIEGEIDELDEVIAGHGDFCAWVASRGTAAAFLKAGLCLPLPSSSILTYNNLIHVG